MISVQMKCSPHAENKQMKCRELPKRAAVKVWEINSRGKTLASFIVIQLLLNP